MSSFAATGAWRDARAATHGKKEKREQSTLKSRQTTPFILLSLQPAPSHCCLITLAFMNLLSPLSEYHCVMQQHSHSLHSTRHLKAAGIKKKDQVCNYLILKLVYEKRSCIMNLCRLMNGHKRLTGDPFPESHAFSRRERSGD